MRRTEFMPRDYQHVLSVCGDGQLRGGVFRLEQDYLGLPRWKWILRWRLKRRLQLARAFLAAYELGRCRGADEVKWGR